MRRTRRRTLRHLAAVALVAVLANGARAEAPSRRDLGDLIVLEVSGTYAEMGRQQAELLGDDLRRVYDLQKRDHERALTAGGAGAWSLDAVGIPLWSRFGDDFDDSHLQEELGGMAEGLGVARNDLLRALMSLGGGSTVFAATRSATADGQALIGRNVDWSDGLGARRPLVVRYAPSNGDLAHLFAGWPLVGVPTVGVNEAGFALSFNYFETDPQIGMWMPEWPHRRALQTARTVEDGIALFVNARERGISTFMVMADASGAIAMVECTTRRCAVFRPEGDWFAQANHARTPEMIPFDLYRSPDSFDRRAGMEAAVARHLGRIDPALTAAILRDRSTHPWPNASNVANLSVLNAAIVHPASRTLWHSTTMQPLAPFGAYEGFTLAQDAAAPAPVPIDAMLASGGFAAERAAVAKARTALHALVERRFGEARDGFDALLAQTPPVLDPARLSLGAGWARLGAGECAGVAAALAPALAANADVEARIYATSLSALCADRLGDRARAAGLHRETLALIEAHPEWNVFAPVAALARDGVAASVADREPAISIFVFNVPL
jgi:hypothetical protein